MHNKHLRNSFALAIALLSTQAWAGNGANFVLYNHHTEKAGNTGVMFMNDFARDENDQRYSAQMLMIERGVTDKWTSEFMVEGQKTPGEPYQATGWRWENRYRPFDYGAFLNPVLYVEWENLKTTTKYQMEVSGRTDSETGEPGATSEGILETRLILGHDFSDRFNVSFNWINETNWATKKTDYGYAFGLNYGLFGAGHDTESHAHHKPSEAGAIFIRELTLGAELYGGLGNSVEGITASSKVTEQYLGLNLVSHLSNGVMLQAGVAKGLTSQSQRDLFRFMIGYDF
ncbi:MAG: hypothetical protein HYX43_05915 [Burkholderiales bacterium]|nr:hypothetical protein [Burkholderiales bacterium]